MHQLFCSSLLVLFLFVCGKMNASAFTFTNDAHIGFANTNLDGQEIVVSNCTLTIDGEHSFLSLRIIDGGLVKHSSSNSGTVTNNLEIHNEALTLIATNFSALAYTNVLPGTVVVSNLDGTVNYAPDTDYTILFGNEPRISRMTGGAIADGETVLVSYTAVIATGPSGMFLTISNDLEIEVDSSINVNGLGFGGNVGPGAGLNRQTNSPTTFTAGSGAGHGGFGGSSITTTGAVSYGSITNPITLGSGGGTGAGLGGAGGGVVRLAVGGTLRVQGSISADGNDGTNSNSGGGSGGSIWIEADRLEGSGSITTIGGAGEPHNGGGGSGGRVAIHCAEDVFSGNISARGGSGWMAGGAGTVYLLDGAESTPTLVLDNGGLIGGRSDTQFLDTYNLILRQGAFLMASNLAVHHLTGREQQLDHRLLKREPHGNRYR